MIKTTCAICELDNHNILYKANFSLKDINEETFSARRLPDKIHYRTVKCKKCGLVYANPRLEPYVIERLYKKSTYTYKQYEDDLIATYSKYLNRFLPKINRRKRFLEIGCGNGFFLKYAQSIGFKEVWGVEPGRETVKKAPKELKKQIITDVFKKGQFKKNYFNLICIFQVFDHIPDPNEFLRECYKILNSKGVILCINHDVNSLQSRLLQDKSPIIDIEHTYLYSKKTLPIIFRKHKFKVISVFDVVNRYPVYYWLRMFPLPKTIKKSVNSLITKIGIGKIKIWFAAGNIGVFTIKQ